MQLVSKNDIDWEAKRTAFQQAISHLSADELQQMLIAKLSLTAESFFESALLLRELEESHGMDMQPRLGRLVPLLRKIAYGQVIPQLVVYCGTDEMLLMRCAALPIPDQRHLLESDGFEFVENDSCRIVDPRSAQPWQIRQLFAGDHIRPPHEQRQWLAGKQQAKPVRRVCIAVRRSRDVTQDEMTCRITVGLTPEWEAAIVEMAKSNSWPKWYAATRFLMSLGKR